MLSVALPRSEVLSSRGIVSSVNPLGTAAGFRALTLGGGSIDAVIACCAVLSVTEPQTGGLGGDTFILHYSAAEDRVWALNGNGQAPAKATPDAFREHGSVPRFGPLASTVPGTVGAWEEALSRWGKLPLTTLLEDAIFLAERGFPVSQRFTRSLTNGAERYLQYESSRTTYFPSGSTPQPGEIFRNPALAESLLDVAENGSESFYRGRLAQRICDGLRAYGGLLEPEDFAAYRPQLKEPVQSSFNGWELFCQPLPSQAMMTLMALGIVERSEVWPREYGTADSVHALIETMKLVFDDRYQYLGDPDTVAVPVEMLLSDEHLRERAARIRLDQARERAYAREGGIPVVDTTCMTAADAEGNLTVYIHSLFAGSGVVAGDTGIMMNNRMSSFVLDPSRPNVVAPGKRPVHTLSTWLARKPGGPVIAGGTPGGDKQVQTNFQMLINLLTLDMDLQTAIAAPRWFIGDGARVEIEEPLGSQVADELMRRGHDVKIVPATVLGGRVVIAQRDANGALRAPQEPRDGGTTTIGW